MQLRSIWGIAVGAMLGLAACGGSSTCDDISNGISNYNKKAQACPNEPQYQTIDKSACDTALNGCSDSDKKALSDYFSCIGNVSACQTDTETAFQDAIAACSSKLANISNSCGLGG